MFLDDDFQSFNEMFDKAQYDEKYRQNKKLSFKRRVKDIIQAQLEVVDEFDQVEF